MHFRFKDGFTTRKKRDKPPERKPIPELLYKVDNSVCRIDHAQMSGTPEKPVLLVYFKPHLYINPNPIGPKIFFRKDDGTWNWHGVEPLSELADIALKRRWARVANMRYEEQPLVRIGGDTDETTKEFVK